MRVCGKNVFNELDYKTVRKVLISDTFKDKEIINKIKNNKLKYIITDSKVMDKMMAHNQGIIIEIDDFSYGTLDDITNDKLVLMLDHLEDPHNFGAIIRTCEAKGIKSIIIPKDRGVIVNETVMKTSSGALNHVNIIISSELSLIIFDIPFPSLPMKGVVNSLNASVAAAILIYGIGD